MLVLIVGIGCKKEHKNVTNSILIGTWIEKAPCNDGICDTIVFREDNTVGSYIPFDEWKYYISTNDSMTFYNSKKSLYLGFAIKIKNYNELTIYNFVDRSITQEIKDITFTKIKNL